MIDREVLEPLCKDGVPLRDISQQLGCSLFQVRYWVKKYSIELLRGQNGENKIRNTCRLCGKEDIVRTICKICALRLRRYINKKRAVDLMGGKCAVCGYSSHYAALEFHHYSGDKEHSLSNILKRSFDRCVIELNKCQLVCSNCHAIIHSRHDQQLEKVAANYGYYKQTNREVAQTGIDG